MALDWLSELTKSCYKNPGCLDPEEKRRSRILTTNRRELKRTNRSPLPQRTVYGWCTWSNLYWNHKTKYKFTYHSVSIFSFWKLYREVFLLFFTWCGFLFWGASFLIQWHHFNSKNVCFIFIDNLHVIGSHLAHKALSLCNSFFVC